MSICTHSNIKIRAVERQGPGVSPDLTFRRRRSSRPDRTHSRIDNRSYSANEPAYFKNGGCFGEKDDSVICSLTDDVGAANTNLNHGLAARTRFPAVGLRKCQSWSASSSGHSVSGCSKERHGIWVFLWQLGQVPCSFLMSTLGMICEHVEIAQ